MFNGFLLSVGLCNRRDKEYYLILKKLFGIVPNNIELYKLALVHRSASLLLEDGSLMNNERLEFLGDAIIESIVSDYLFIEFPEGSEGFLTRLRSRIVSRATLNSLAKEIGLDKHLISNGGGSSKHLHIYGDALEAIIGAMYLDKGYEFTNRYFINKILREKLNLDQLSHTENDYKSRVLEWSQKSRRNLKFITSCGDESGSNTGFVTSVLLEGEEIAKGEGRSKKEAEQSGALRAIESGKISDFTLDGC